MRELEGENAALAEESHQWQDRCETTTERAAELQTTLELLRADKTALADERDRAVGKVRTGICAMLRVYEERLVYFAANPKGHTQHELHPISGGLTSPY